MKDSQIEGAEDHLANRVGTHLVAEVMPEPERNQRQVKAGASAATALQVLVARFLWYVRHAFMLFQRAPAGQSRGSITPGIAPRGTHRASSQIFGNG